jgi:alkylation response protein AidB-like acyl-CoA dehydrogenase
LVAVPDPVPDPVPAPVPDPLPDPLRGSALLAAARRLADELLRPHAADVDVGDVPRSHLDALGEAGILGLPAAERVAKRERRAVQEVLAGADCATWFVAVQHFSPLAMLLACDAPVRERLLAPMTAGRTVAGVAFAHVRRWPDRPVQATRVTGGWRFDGVAPWYTGWGRNDVFVIAGVTDRGEVVSGFTPARPSPSLQASAPLRMAAMTATRTVRLTLAGLVVHEGDVVVHQPIEQWLREDSRTTVNVAPAVFGITAEALRLLRETADGTGASSGARAGARTGAESAADRFGERLASVRARADYLLDEVDPDERHNERLEVRAVAQQLMTEVTTALVAAGGGRSMLLSTPAQRLAREALFLLVQAQTRPAREALLARWASGGS